MSEKPAPSTADAVDGYVAALIEAGEDAEALRIDIWNKMTVHRAETIKSPGIERQHLRTVMRATGKPVGDN